MLTTSRHSPAIARPEWAKGCSVLLACKPCTNNALGVPNDDNAKTLSGLV